VAGDEDARAAVFVEHARRYSELGWALIVLNGKVPRSRQWQEAVPEDPELAAGKWAQWGKQHEIGVNLGASRLAVIEDDTAAARAKLVELLGDDLAGVPIVESGGRSQHRYYLDAGYENASRDGLELRCGRQQCVLPPSTHLESGRPYRWLVEPWAIELTPVPSAVLDFFAQSKGKLFAGPVGDEIRKPGRRRALLSLAGTLRRRGLGADEILVALEAVNATRCKPPLSDGELAELARDIARRYAPAPPDREQVRIEQEAEQALEGPEKPTAKRPRKRQAHTRAIATIATRPTEWLISNIIPLGTLSLVAGIGGLGKSGLLLAWAAPVTRAGHNVLIVSYEDAAEQVLRPRFEALDGKLERLHELYVDPLDGSVSFPTDLPELERHARALDARMVVIDPVSAAIDLRLDSHRDQDVRVVLGQLAKLAERERLAIVQNAHLNKAPSTDPYLRINGSTAFYNAARSVLTVSEDPLDRETQRLVAHHKSNYGPLAPVQRWKIEAVSVPSDFGPIETMRMVFVEDAEDVDRQDVLGAAVTEKRTDAATLITAELAFGRRLSSEVKEAGAKRGISPATIKRSAQDLGVVVEEETTTTGRVTYWALPGSAPALVPQFEPTPQEPLNQAETEGSAQISDGGRDLTNPGGSS
jgi:AAA domain/Bifunctional DNA primase/polymerase, N-terminal